MDEIKDESPDIVTARQTIAVLEQVIQKLQQNDYTSAQVMAGIASHLLEGLQTDLNYHLTVEKMLREMLKNP